MNKITDIKRRGPVQKQSANGISINRFNRFIILLINKQMEAISCKIFTFFISYHLFKCIIPYFSRKFKNFSPTRIPITPKACISSATCCGISSTQSVVYHHCERRYSLRLMIYTYGDDMPLLSQWIKNSTSFGLSNFWPARADSNR